NVQVNDGGPRRPRTVRWRRDRADQDGLQPALQGLLGEDGPREVREGFRRAARRREPHGAPRLRRLPGRRRAGCQGPVRPSEQDVVLTATKRPAVALPAHGLPAVAGSPEAAGAPREGFMAKFAWTAADTLRFRMARATLLLAIVAFLAGLP